LIKTSFGGATTNFNLPDLRGRVPVGLHSSGTFNSLNKQGGYENVTLTTAQMPNHSHTLASCLRSDSGTANFTLNVPGTTIYKASQSTGGDEAHANMPPYIVVNYIIKY